MITDRSEVQSLTDIARDILEGRVPSPGTVRILMEDERQQAALKIRMLSLLADSVPPALREQVNRLAIFDEDHRTLYALLLGGTQTERS